MEGYVGDKCPKSGWGKTVLSKCSDLHMFFCLTKKTGAYCFCILGMACTVQNPIIDYQILILNVQVIFILILVFSLIHLKSRHLNVLSCDSIVHTSLSIPE